MNFKPDSIVLHTAAFRPNASANELALCIGESPADCQTFTQANYKDSAGNKYAVASTVASETLLQLAEGELKAPDYAPNADLEAAARTQALMQLVSLDNPVLAGPDRIVVMIGDRNESALDHIEAMGLTRFEPETDE